MADPYAHHDDMLGDLDAPPRISGLAVAALVCGILCCIPVVGLMAVILGGASLVAIRQAEGRLGGKTLAIVAIVLGSIGTVAWGAIYYGARQGYISYTKGAVEPAQAALRGIEVKDWKAAKDLLEPGVRAKLTDADWAVFADGIGAKFGLVQGQPTSMDWSVINPQGVPAHATFVPVFVEFQQGPGVVFLISDTSNILTGVVYGGDVRGNVTNILVQGRGKQLWLIDPMKAPSAGAAPAPKPEAPQTAPTGPTGATGSSGPS